MSKYSVYNDPALGSFIRFVERVALSARRDYLKHSKIVCNHEFAVDSLPEASDGADLLEHITWGLDELSGDLALCTTLRGLTAMEKQVLVLSILEDRPVEATCRQLHISLGRAYQLRRKALGKLKNALLGGDCNDTV